MKMYLELEELRLLELSTTNARDRLLIRLLSRLRCQISEALALTLEDIDFQDRSVTIQHLKTRLKVACPYCSASLGASHIFCPRCGLKVEGAVSQSKKQRRVRVLPLDCETFEIIREYVDQAEPVLRHGKQLLFGIGRSHGWRIVRDCAKRAGLKELVNPETGKTRGISPHRLRDAFAVHAMKIDDSGEGMRLLQEHLGHDSFNTTAKYRKVAGEEHREWYESLWSKTV